MSIHHNRLYTLLRQAIGSTNGTESFDLLEGMTDNEWQELFLIANKQGVKLIAYEGVNSLPQQYRPTSKFHLKWYLSVVQAEQRYKHYKESVGSLAQLLEGLGIKTVLVLKGVTVAELYKIPARREGGDIDLYLRQEKSYCDKLLKDNGIEVNTSVPKNSMFNFNGISVENHEILFDPKMAFKREADMYARAQKMIDKLIADFGLNDFELGEIKIKDLHPQCAALYYALHLFRHATCPPLVMRQFCDWVVTFNYFRDRIDVNMLREQFTELGLLTFIANVELFCKQKFGYEPYIANSETASQAAVDLLDEIMIVHSDGRPQSSLGITAIKHKFLRQKAYSHFFGPTSYFECLFPELARLLNHKVRSLVCKK